MKADFQEMKTLVLSCVAASAKPARHSSVTLADDFDLVREGALDSLGFIKLISELEKRLGIQIDFDGMDSEQVTVLGPLCRHIASLRAR
jgi:acyl carrier protein